MVYRKRRPHRYVRNRRPFTLSSRNYRIRTGRPRKMRIPTQPFKNQVLVKLRYVTEISLDPGAAGAAATHIMSANGLFDPDITGVGHQPMGFDELMAIYNHYTVVGSKCWCTFQARVATAADNLVCGIRLDADTTAITDSQRQRELRDSRYSYLNALGSSKPLTIANKVSMKKHFNRKSIVQASQFSGTVAANPTEQLFYHVWAAAADTIDNPSALTGNVTVEYLVVFTEPRPLGSS